MERRHLPHVTGDLRSHIVTVPEEIWKCSGIVILGRRIKSLVFTTDIAIIRNCNADAVLAVYPFTPQQVISNSIIQASNIPVLCGVGGGMTGGDRTVRLSKDAEAQGASGVVVNAPMTNDVIEKMAKVIDIPIIATVLSEKADIQARLDAGVSILNVSAAARTPEVVSAIREKFPKVPIIATGGPTGESIARTIGAGANSISYTPPSTKELFSRTMEDYRSRELYTKKEPFGSFYFALNTHTVMNGATRMAARPMSCSCFTRIAAASGRPFSRSSGIIKNSPCFRVISSISQLPVGL